LFLLFSNPFFSMLPMITTNIADSKITANIVENWQNNIEALKCEIRMLTKEQNECILPYYEAALEILTKNKSKKDLTISK
jgi:hypothetical protein